MAGEGRWAGLIGQLTKSGDAGKLSEDFFFKVLARDTSRTRNLFRSQLSAKRSDLGELAQPQRALQTATTTEIQSLP